MCSEFVLLTDWATHVPLWVCAFHLLSVQVSPGLVLWPLLSESLSSAKHWLYFIFLLKSSVAVSVSFNDLIISRFLFSFLFRNFSPVINVHFFCHFLPIHFTVPSVESHEITNFLVLEKCYSFSQTSFLLSLKIHFQKHNLDRLRLRNPWFLFYLKGFFFFFFRTGVLNCGPGSLGLRGPLTLRN